MYTDEYPLDKVHPRAVEKLHEFKLCSHRGEKIRDEEIVYDTENKAIPDEKWLTLTQQIGDLQDLKILAEKILVDYTNWQTVFKRHTISAMINQYVAYNEAEIDGVPLRNILERERDNAQWDNLMALFSSIAYLNEKRIRDFLKAFGIKENDILTINNEETDTQGFFFRFKMNEEKTITIHTWRGTDSRRDWLTNFNTGFPDLSFWKPKSIFIHRGIRKALKATFNDILAFLNNEPDTISVLTGHSLGGGLANASVPVLIENNNKIARLTTFGAEKSLSKAGVTQLAPKITAGATRWISHSDPVPYMPPWLDVIGTVFYFNNDDGPVNIKNEPPVIRERTLMGLKSFGSTENPVHHHDLDCYLFKTRHLAAYLRHILKGCKGEYPYRYPHPKML